MSSNRILSVQDLTVIYRRGRQRTVALDGVSLHVDRGESVALIGESGAGKSTVARSILGLVKPTSGKIEILDRDLSRTSRRETARLRGQVQTVMQNPFGSLDPRWRIGRIVAEPLWSNHRFAEEKMSRNDIKAQARTLLEEVGLGADKERVRPIMLSGGERQRVAIARALAVHPAVLVADEPVTALDNTTRSQVVELFRRIAMRSTTGMLLISHSMSFVSELADRVYVITEGKIVEDGPIEEVMERPRHEYTQKLLAASRALDYEPRSGAGSTARLPVSALTLSGSTVAEGRDAFAKGASHGPA